jgi:hypothetical protein
LFFVKKNNVRCLLIKFPLTFFMVKGIFGRLDELADDLFDRFDRFLLGEDESSQPEPVPEVKDPFHGDEESRVLYGLLSDSLELTSNLVDKIWG